MTEVRVDRSRRLSVGMERWRVTRFCQNSLLNVRLGDEIRLEPL